MGRVWKFWMRSGFLVAAVTVILMGCNEASPTEPKDPDIDMVVAGDEAPLLTHGLVCDSLRAPAGNRLVAALYAEGDQVYRWSGSAWTFVEPSARLYVSRFLKWPVGTHYAGPTWEASGGSKVLGSVVRRCAPNANAIPWLLLSATSSTSYGLFKGITFIQRVGTVGGNAPATAGDSVGAIARVPYSTEYLFYRGR
jgi:hypothetical protein